jgi:hypothetical protein
MSTLLTSLSHVELVELVIELQQKFPVTQNSLNEQLRYVAELEEGVRNLAEQLEERALRVLLQSKELSHLQLEYETSKLKWTEQQKSLAN